MHQYKGCPQRLPSVATIEVVLIGKLNLQERFYNNYMTISLIIRMCYNRLGLGMLFTNYCDPCQ